MEVKKSSQVQIYFKGNVIAHNLGFGFLDVKEKKSKALAQVTGWLVVLGWGKGDGVII